MKIIILCSNYEPGGAQRVALRLNAALLSRGLDAHCVFMHRKCQDFSQEAPIMLYNKKVKGIIGFLITLFKTYRFIKTNKPDVVLSFLPVANILGQLIAFLCGVKIRVASHRTESSQELSFVQKKLDQLFAEIGIYSWVTAVSKSTKMSFNYYSKTAFSRITIVNNGLDYIKPTMSKTDSRILFDIPRDAFVLGNVGRFVQAKNHVFMLELLKNTNDVVLALVGKGHLQDSIISKARTLGLLDKIIFIPEIKTDNIPDFLNSIDVFIMPSLFEGMSNALVEALHAGLPILASDVPSQRDVLFDEKNDYIAGKLLPLDNTAIWIESINQIKNSTEYRQELKALALRRSSVFTVDNMVDGYLRVFEMKVV